MTPAAQRKRLEGQATIAKKVFEVVPIRDAWSIHQMMSHLTKITKSHIDYRVMQGCLSALKDSGLVREPQRGFFQRVEVREETVKTEVQGEIDVPNLKTESKPAAPASPIDVLDGIAGRLRRLRDDADTLASDIETAALVIAEQGSETQAAVMKARQLQQLLQELGGIRV
ncbi:hypothetical protein [Burkholderia anthina]|uniref:Uncharacterized protein n=1 Tax=Burkholderia anthina TaxID=179879 RepID=A0A6P2GDM2_9BURK|nr:hypothetical protein [Burkholderia anthina]MBM2769905.1 hypothetical protein [Burkholderia anthina]VVU51880.1 hypothetical protein BAN20980_04603 [Burkholderia anthina]